MNITIDDTSPTIQFYSASGGWSTDHTYDPQVPNYYGQTFHSTETNGDYVVLKFNGSAVYVYGAKRGNHGTYAVQLDDGSQAYYSGYDADGTYQTVLFAAGGLSTTSEHTLVITNLPQQTSPPPVNGSSYYLDIDYFIVQYPPPSDTTFQTYFDDTSDKITYSGGWSAENNADSYNNTRHLSFHVDDELTFHFNGSSVQMFGGIDTDHGNYSVVLDGGLQQVFNGTSIKYRPNTTIFVASGLEDTMHTVTITNIGEGPGPNGGSGFEFDWALVNSTINPGGTSGGGSTTGSTDPVSPSPPSTPSGSSSSGSSSHTGAIAGGVVGGIVAVALAGILVWFWFFRKRGGRSAEGAGVRDSQYTGRFDIDGNGNGSGYDGREVRPYDAMRNSGTFGATTYGHFSGYGSVPSASPSPSPLPAAPTLTAGVTTATTDADADGTSTSARGAGEDEHTDTPFLSSIPLPPGSTATSYPLSPESVYSRETSIPPASHSGSSRAGSSAGGGDLLPPSSQNPPRRVPTLIAAAKTPNLQFAFGTRAAPTDVPHDAEVEDPDEREEDAGPVPPQERRASGMLPPSYMQATRPISGLRVKS